MTDEEYNAKKQQLIDQHREDLKALARKLVESKNTVSAGDTVGDRVGKILVEKMGVHHSPGRLPAPCYYGPELTVKGQPRKDGRKRWAYPERVL